MIAETSGGPLSEEPTTAEYQILLGENHTSGANF
jgi:hypothetical protein